MSPKHFHLIVSPLKCIIGCLLLFITSDITHFPRRCDYVCSFFFHAFRLKMRMKRSKRVFFVLWGASWSADSSRVNPHITSHHIHINAETRGACVSPPAARSTKTAALMKICIKAQRNHTAVVQLKLQKTTRPWLQECRAHATKGFKCTTHSRTHSTATNYKLKYTVKYYQATLKTNVVIIRILVSLKY